ncbi:MAG: YedE family putative selenium transporter [Leptotrichiaceae bacterium]|nr:YedE family putative selenium transporter [Leptotrichiaceae bacterium]
MDFINSKKGLFVSGILAGLIGVWLAVSGNPKNMAICVACFIRDISGSMKFHNASVVQYFRPEIPGIVLGAFIISIFTKEFKVTGGSSPVIRFFSGIAMMIGALIFLGCPTRMILRIAGGDLSAYIGFTGFAAGIGTGVFFLKKGYSLEKKVEIKKENGYIFPLILILLLILSVTTGLFAVSEKGPGSIHAPLVVSLVGGMMFGMIAQKVRMCFTGSIRNIFLMKNFEMITPILGMFTVILIYNIITGNFKFSPYGPIAHPHAIWNILGLYAVGLAGVLMGGCPLRQLVLAGQGSSDSVITVIGLFVGAAVAHNFKLAAAVASKATATSPETFGGPNLSGKIALFFCILFLIAVGIIGTKKGKINEGK